MTWGSIWVTQAYLAPRELISEEVLKQYNFPLDICFTRKKKNSH